jgi:AAA domain
MFDYDDLNLGFDEKQLPPGQKPIETRNIKRFNFFIKLLIESKQKTGYSTMGIVTGRSGIGKTIAIWNYLNSLQPRSHTGIPECIGIRVIPGTTPRTLVKTLYDCFGESESGKSRYEIANEAAKAIIENDVKLLFVDEADLLNVDCFELLRYIFDKTGCPIIVVGLPRILHVIDIHTKFKGRTPLRLPFYAPTEHEILHTILPQLVFPGWTYDPKNEKDLAMGQELWKKVQPSLRDLRAMLEYASQIAEIRKAAKITPKILKEVYQMRPSYGRRQKLDESVDEIESNVPLTEAEIESQQRQDAKKKQRPSTEE